MLGYMKYLKHWTPSILNDQFAGRLVGIDGPIEGDEVLSEEWEENNSLLSNVNREQLNEDEKKQEIEAVLKNPLRFSLHDIRFLEQNQDVIESDKALQKSFRRTVDHFLSLAGENSMAFPQTLFYLKSSRLKRFIPNKQGESIKFLVGQESKNIRKLADRDAGSWTTNETSKVLSLYKYLKRRSKEAQLLDETFKKVAKGLVEKALDIAEVSQNHEAGDLKYSEKLILWDIQRLFPREFATNNRVASILQGESINQAEKLLQDLERGDAANDPELFWVWASLEDLALKGDVELSSVQKRQLRKFMLRYNSAQMLEGIKGNTVLLPSHLHSLGKLQNDEDIRDILGRDAKNTQVSEEFKPHKPAEDGEKESALLIKLREKEIEIDEAKNGLMENLLKRDAVTEEYKEGYLLAKDELDRYISGEGNSADLAVAALRDFPLLAGDQKFQAKLSVEFSKWSQSDLSAPKKLQILKAIISKAENWISSSENIETLGDQRDAAMAKIEGLESVQEEWLTLENKLKEQEQTIRGKVEALPSNELKELEEERRELQGKYAKQKHESAHAREFFELARDTKAKAEEIESAYWDGLEQRIEKHQLHAADIEVLFHYNIDGGELEDDADLQNEQRRLSGAVENIEPPEVYQEFKTAFISVLDDVAEDSLGGELDLNAIDRNELDAFEPWLQEIERRMGMGVLASQLQPSLSRFDSKQVQSELIKGAMAYYKDDVLAKVEAALPDDFREDRKQKFLNTLRSHHTIADQESIGSIDEAYKQYRRLQKADDLKLDVERTNLGSALEGIDEENQEKIHGAFAANEQMMRYGFTAEGDTDPIFPGTERLEVLRLQILPLIKEVKSFWKPYTDNLTDIAHYATNREKESDLIREVKIKEFISSWDGAGRVEISSLIQRFKDQVKNEFKGPEHLAFQDFIRQLEEKIDLSFDSIDSTIEQFKSFNKDGGYMTGNENFFAILPNQIDKLSGLMDFDSGFTADNKAAFEKIFYAKDDEDVSRGFANTVQKLKTWGLFDEDEVDENGRTRTGKEKAQDRFDELRAEFNEKTRIFDDNIKGVKRRIHLDKKLSDEEFEDKYSFPKDEADHILNGYDQYKGQFDETWNQFNQPSFFETWWDRYQQDDLSRANAINQFHQLENLTETAKEMVESSEGLKSWLKGWDENAQSGKSSIKWQRIAIYDIFLIIKGCVENHEKNWKRKRESAAYQLGQDLFGDTLWGKEFRRLAEDSEEARIKEWEGNYHDLDGWDVRDKLYHSTDPDESRACINLLNEKGFLAWDDPRLWRTLMRLGGGVIFNIPEDQNLPIGDIMEKVKGSCELIWSRDVFRNWEGNFKSNHEKAMGFFDREFSNLESSSGGREKILSDMLSNWKRGEETDVDPAKYESFIVNAIKAGKMNGQPDKRWFYLIMGVGVKNPHGQTILSREALQRIQELMNNMPHVEFFVDKKAYKYKGKVVPKDAPGAEERPWNFEDFGIWADDIIAGQGDFDIDKNETIRNNTTDFFYKTMRMSDQARDRAQRVQRNAKGEADHDDAATFASEWSVEQVGEALVTLSEGTSKLTPDFWRTFLDGYDLYFQKTWEVIKEGNSQYAASAEWQKEKRRLLEEVGQRLRAAIVATQVLSGNFDYRGQGRNSTFSKNDWNKSTMYSPQASASKAKINGFAGRLFRSANADKKYIDLLDVNLVDEGIGPKTPKGQGGEKYEQLNGLNKELASGEKGNDIFLNHDLVEEQLRKYVEGA